MPKLYIVKLSDEERKKLLTMVNTGVNSARGIIRARILLLSDEGKIDEDIAEALKIHTHRVARIRKRFAEGGLEKALNERPRSGKPLSLDEKGEATLIALACSDPPGGHTVWTLQLLANKLVQLQVVDTLSYETVRLYLKEAHLNLGRNGIGRLPR
ncbi:MAG TPA: helix-turn-helix domain-containing protein [Candidatus Hodarchaeales archaeon]|nr:helix-turn-helix domain-containing protein [Candidatus Hodarchaeales archaeon]